MTLETRTISLPDILVVQHEELVDSRYLDPSPKAVWLPKSKEIRVSGLYPEYNYRLGDVALLRYPGTTDQPYHWKNWEGKAFWDVETPLPKNPELTVFKIQAEGYHNAKSITVGYTTYKRTPNIFETKPDLSYTTEIVVRRDLENTVKATETTSGDKTQSQDGKMYTVTTDAPSEEDETKVWNKLIAEYESTCRVVAGCGTRGQHYIDKVMSKIREFVRQHPKFGTKLPGHYQNDDDGVSGTSVAVASVADGCRQQ